MHLQPDNIRPLTKHRKIASSFRDTMLFEIFNMACNLLKQASKGGSDLQDDSKVKKIIYGGLVPIL